MRHHTKDKGDTGLGFVMADLLKNGIQVALPISEHLPFDCIAISENNELLKISVKYRKKKKGSVEVRLRSYWADKKGNHTNEHQHGDYDVIAIYCPDVEECYYIKWNEIEKSASLTLRIEEPKNGQKNGIRMASDYKDVKRIF